MSGKGKQEFVYQSDGQKNASPYTGGESAFLKMTCGSQILRSKWGTDPSMWSFNIK